tara:strand:+ start:1308 stop:3029 length:1722 start_codon:yes stop_codon:yes gene_type:complete
MKKIIFLFFVSFFCSAQIYVPEQFSSIQEAINFSENGDTIIVSSQINNYTGFIEVNKELNIISSSDEVIVDASGLQFGFKINSSSVVIDGFNIIGNDSTNAGIIITPGCQNIEINNNVISGMSLPNLSNDSPLSYGILSYGNGETINPPTNIIIYNNSIFNVSGSAISLGSYSANVSILNNNISNISSVQYMGLPTSIGINAEYTDSILIQNNSFNEVINASNLLSSNGSIFDNSYSEVSILLSKYIDDQIFFSANLFWIEYISDNYIFYLYQDTILGCIDPLACNYNSNANSDDNSCIYANDICDTCSGETDGTGTVVDNDLDNDGVCDDDEVLGCTDAEACNYNILATDEDDSCIYPSETYLDCNGDCLSDLDLDGICDEIDDDIDGDGIDNNWENENGLNPYDPQDSLSDLDQDGLSNIEEYIYSTNPNNIDTDGDGLNDFDEINSGFDPLLPNTDCDNDGIFDYFDEDSCIIFIPDGFSPNGDGFNDYFEIVGLENLSPQNELIVFNRWGQIVFKENNYNNDWSGYNNSSNSMFTDKLSSGTYYYIFRTINAVPSIGDREYKGYVYINR